MKDVMFEKYVDLIRSRVWNYAKIYNIDYSELESQGFLIYCECLEKYDVTKSGFSTYLYIQLNRIADFCKTYNRQKGELVQDYFANDVIDKDLEINEQIESYSDNPSLSEFLSVAKDCLSLDAFDVMKWILERSWERKNKRTPTISMAVKALSKSKSVVEDAWNECSLFWKNQGCLVYC